MSSRHESTLAIPPQSPAAVANARRHGIGLPLLLVGLIGLAWSGALHAPFVFDDHSTVLGNPSIQGLNPLRWFCPPATAGETVSGRPVLNLSFAIDHVFCGTSPFGYHLTNLAIHAVAVLLLYGLVRRVLALREGGIGARGSDLLASAAAACWALHPLQTAAVTYVSQRAESLAGCFLLLMHK